MAVTYNGGAIGQAPTLDGLENPTKIYLFKDFVPTVDNGLVGNDPG